MNRRESIGQVEMPLQEGGDCAPVASIEDVRKVSEILARLGQLTAAEITRELGLVPNENSKRRVRAIARAARPGIVSFPNSAGYKLFEQCTVEEIRSCVNHWASVERDAAQTRLLFQNRLFLAFGSNA